MATRWNCLGALLCLLPGSAQAQESALHTLVGLRIQDDLSGVCVSAQRIAPGPAGLAVDATTRCASSTRSLPARPSYRFDLGALAGGLAGVLLAEMVERGEVALDEPLQAFLPQGVNAPGVDGRAITLRDLVTHTAGLPPLPTPRPASPGGRWNDASDAAAVHASLAHVELTQAPGARYRESGWGYMLLSDALARRAAKPFEVLLRERVLEPLGMADTTVGGTASLLPGHTSGGGQTPPRTLPPQFAGAGGVRSTAGDMATFARALLGDVPARAPQSLRRALAVAPRKLREVNRNIAMAMGWRLTRHGDREYVTLDDSGGGFSSAVALDLQQRIAAVVLADAAGGFDDLALRLLEPGAPMSAPRRAAPLDPSSAQALAGRYALHDGVVLAVTWVDGKLRAQVGSEPPAELRHDTRGDFHAVAFDALLRFTREADGTASGLSLFEGASVTRGTRIAR